MLEKKFRVKDLIYLDSLAGIQVLAGHEYLDNTIHNINVMEVPDVENWVQAEEFLMTTGYMYRDHCEYFLSLIPKLKERKIAALGIKTKRYIEEIPSEIIQCAQDNDLPLLALPVQTTFSLVIREVMEKILLSDFQKEEQIVYQMLHSNEITESEMLDILSSADIHPTESTSYHIILPMEPIPSSSYDVTIIKQALQNKISTLPFRILSMKQETIAVLICITDNENVWNSWFYSANNPLTELASKYKLSFLISEPQNQLLKLNETFSDVKKLLFSARALSLDTAVITWQTLGIYSALPFLKRTPFHKYTTKKYIEPISAYDIGHGTSLLETLQAYVTFNGNMRAAAKYMYIHYNTMCYRMNLIKEIFNFDFTDINELTCLNLAFKLNQ